MIAYDLDKKLWIDNVLRVFMVRLPWVYITLDASGVMAYYMKDGEMVEALVPSVKVDHVVDTTGCGDSFAGGLAFSLLKYRGDYIKAAQFGNAMGAQRTQGKTFEVFKSFEKTRKEIEENYGVT